MPNELLFMDAEKEMATLTIHDARGLSRDGAERPVAPDVLFAARVLAALTLVATITPEGAAQGLLQVWKA